MKFYHIIIIAILILSCRSNPNKTNNGIIKNQPPEKDTISSSFDISAEKVDTNNSITGQWLNQKYIRSILEYKSAREAQKTIYLAFINLKPENKASMIYSFHEGVDREYQQNADTLIFFNGLEIDKTAILINTDTMIIKSGQKIDTLVRFMTSDINGNIVAINKLLFEGVYTSDENSIVQFHQNGSLTGINGYLSYRVRADYYDMGLDLDLIYLENKDETLKLTWEINNDTLKLFKVNCKSFDDLYGYCIEIEKGSLVYQLIKTN